MLGPRRALSGFVAWLRRRGWGPHHAIAASLAGLGSGVYTMMSAVDSTGADRVVAAVVAVACLLGGLVFFAALWVMRDERPKTSKPRLSDNSFRWPGSRGRGGPDRGGRP